MIYGLIILFCLIIFELFIILFLFSDFVVNIEECDISYEKIPQKGLSINKLKINIEIRILKIIKIFNIKINEKYCEILKIKVKFNGLKKLKDYNQSSLEFIIKNIGKLNPEIKKINMNLSIGTEEPILTTFSIPIVSTLIAVLISKKMQKIDKGKCRFRINPLYLNSNIVLLKVNGIISLDTLKVLYFIKKHRKIKI